MRQKPEMGGKETQAVLSVQSAPEWLEQTSTGLEWTKAILASLRFLKLHFNMIYELPHSKYASFQGYLLNENTTITEVSEMEGNSEVN